MGDGSPLLLRCAASSVGFAALLAVCHAWAAPALGAPRGALRLQVASHLVSTVHAAAAAALGARCLAESAQSWGDPRARVWGATERTRDAAALFVGYLSYDLLCVLALRPLREAATVAHHVLFLAVATTCLRLEALPFPFAWLIMGELSTPFVNTRFMLTAIPGARDKHPRLYLANGLALVATFVATRVALYGAGLFDLLTTLRPLVAEGGAALRAVPPLLVAGYALNLFWAAKLLRGAAKQLRPKAA